MSVESRWGHFFKPEVRKKGSEELAKGLISLSAGSDTSVLAYVKGSARVKVTFSSPSIDHDTFWVDCSCSSSAKGVFCKHIWSVLLLVEKNKPDFLDSKTTIEKKSGEDKQESPYKAKQAEYRKLQYQKQKLQAQKRKVDKKKSEAPPRARLAEPIEAALAFFAENGFAMETEIEEEFLKNAKKRLSRVFHPDIGGSHEETILLNKHYDVLMEFLNS